MEQNLKEYLVEETHQLMAAPSCCKDAKDAAQHWLDSLDTPDEPKATEAYLNELAEDILPIDDLIAFCSSEQGEQLFGKERAAAAAAHGKELKHNGAKYCDCAACSAAEAILSKKEELLKD